MQLSEVPSFHSRGNELKSLQYYPSSVDTRDLLSTMIADFIFNSFLTYTAIILNVVTIFVIHKTSTTAKVVEPFLSDVACGLLGQPFYTSLLVKWLQMENLRCNAYLMLSISGVTFITASPPGGCKALMMPLAQLVQLLALFQR